jgi:hypothetical protein
LMRRSLPHPNPPLGKGRGQESHFSRGNSSHIKLKVVNDNLTPPLSKGRLGGVEIYASSPTDLRRHGSWVSFFNPTYRSKSSS